MDYTELFDRYLDGKLKGKELKDLERRLESDPALKDELERFRVLDTVAENSIDKDSSAEEISKVDEATDKLSLEDISEFGKAKRGLPDSDLSDFEQVMKKAEARYFSMGITKHDKIRFVWYGSAAALIIAVLISGYFLFRDSQQKKADLYAVFFKPYIKSEKIFELTRSNDDFYYAVKVFEAGDFSRAALLFDNLSDSSELEVYALFYAGLTSIEQGRWEDAISSFIQVIGCGENQISYGSRWYLGLCYLRIDNEEAARNQFVALSIEKNLYSRKARQILRIMKRR